MSSAAELPVRPTRLTISLDAVCRNVARLKEISGGNSVLAVVKANCYGLGAIPISRALSEKGLAACFGVATLYEGVSLREQGIKEDILILGPLAEEELEAAIVNRLMPCLYRKSTVEAVERTAAKLGLACKSHIKVDSGMGRLGFTENQAGELLAALAECRHIKIEGVFSALASADDPGSDQTKRQVVTFLRVLDRLGKAGIKPKFAHIANSAGLLFHPDTRLGLVRPGLAMYGMVPGPELDAKGLEPVARFETRILQVKTLPKGSEIGYSATYTTNKEEKFALLPVGYGDGLPRILSEKGGSVIIKGRRTPFRGRISMDLSLVSLEGIDAAEGDKVTLWGKEGTEEVTPWEWALMGGTIPYEITCGISPRVPRIYELDGRSFHEIAPLY